MLQYRSIVPGAYKISIPYQDISRDIWLGALDELEACKVSEIDEPSGNSNNINRKYYPSGEHTGRIVAYLQSRTWTQSLIELANMDLEYVRNWGYLDPAFLERCHFTWTWHSLRAGYDETDWHVDSLKQVIHGLFFIQPEAAPLSATLFAHNNDGDTDGIDQPTTGIGEGWVIFQNGRTYHRGRNLTQKPRFGLKFSYQLWSGNRTGMNYHRRDLRAHRPTPAS